MIDDIGFQTFDNKRCRRDPQYENATYVQGLLTSSLSAVWFAPTIKVAWERSDLARWSNALPTPTASSSIATATSSTSSISTSVITQSTSPVRDGLSTGAKVGIGLGAAAGGLAVLATLYFLGLRYRGKQGQSEELTNAPLKAELPGNVSDKPGIESSAVQSKAWHAEADDTSAIVELESGWRGWEGPASTGPIDQSSHPRE